MTFRLTVEYRDGRTTRIKTSDAIFMASTWTSVMEKRDTDGVTGASILYKADPAPVVEKTANTLDPIFTDPSPSFNPGPVNRPRPSEQLPGRATALGPIVTDLSPVGDVDVINQSGKRARTGNQTPTEKRRLTSDDIIHMGIFSSEVLEHSFRLLSFGSSVQSIGIAGTCRFLEL